MGDRILIFYGSYRSDRQGIRLAEWPVDALAGRGASAGLIDAKAVGLPMLDRMYKEYPTGEAPPALETLAEKIRTADAFVFVAGASTGTIIAFPSDKGAEDIAVRASAAAPVRHIVGRGRDRPPRGASRLMRARTARAMSPSSPVPLRDYRAGSTVATATSSA